MKIKNVFSIVVFLLFCMEVYPQDVQNLVIWTRDGGRIVYALDEKPVTRFVGADLVLPHVSLR